MFLGERFCALFGLGGEGGGVSARNSRRAADDTGLR